MSNKETVKKIEEITDAIYLYGQGVYENKKLCDFNEELSNLIETERKEANQEGYNRGMKKGVGFTKDEAYQKGREDGKKEFVRDGMKHLKNGGKDE